MTKRVASPVAAGATKRLTPIARPVDPWGGSWGLPSAWGNAWGTPGISLGLVPDNTPRITTTALLALEADEDGHLLTEDGFAIELQGDAAGITRRLTARVERPVP